ncbi:MAG: glycoside hydrolase family 13 protein [Anaerolineae bacterium]
MPIQTPDWVKDAVFYQIFPDRFARSEAVPKPTNLEPWESPPTPHGYKGGDLIGVVEHLDYLEALGITAIYFNPIFQSASNHRYHTHDYYRVDPILGGNEAFRVLLDAAHARGIRVVIDGVFNHASRGFYQFNSILEDGEKSPYIDWFHINGFPLHAYETSKLPNYAAWWNLHALPKFNTDNPAVREFIWGVAEHWIHFGADGWRLDVPEEIDDDSFWQEFRRRVKAANPEAYIVGEIWFPAQRWLQGDQFDAVMNYLFTRPAIGFFGRCTLSGLHSGPYTIDPIDAAAFAAQIEQTVTMYDWEIVQAQLNLLGSHDTPRFLSMVGEDVSALKLATLCQMTLPGAPCVYYGDELGLTGGYEPASRNTIPWDRVNALQGDLWHTVQEAIALRKAHPVLRRGSYQTVLAEGDRLAYRRDLNGVSALVVFNTGQDPARYDLPFGSRFAVAFGAPEAVQHDGEQVQLTLPARSGAVLITA